MVRAIRHSPKSVAPTEKIPKANTICIASIDMWFPPLEKFYKRCDQPYLLLVNHSYRSGWIGV